MLSRSAIVLIGFLLILRTTAIAQPMTLAEVQATGATPMTGEQVKALVTGAKVELTLVSGSTRIWTNEASGEFSASRNIGNPERRSARGTWSVDADGAYCLTFDWGGQDKESWCRLLYQVADRHYSFGKGGKPDTRSGSYRFTR